MTSFGAVSTNQSAKVLEFTNLAKASVMAIQFFCFCCALYSETTSICLRYAKKLLEKYCSMLLFDTA